MRRIKIYVNYCGECPHKLLNTAGQPSCNYDKDVFITLEDTLIDKGFEENVLPNCPLDSTSSDNDE